MSAPITGAEIVALPGWRWCTGLAVYSPSEEDVCGVCRMEGGRPLLLACGGVESLLEDAEPDPTDPLLPGWLLHLLIERIPGERVSLTHGGRGGAWSVMVGFSRTDGPTELHALVDALRRAS